MQIGGAKHTLLLYKRTFEELSRHMLFFECFLFRLYFPKGWIREGLGSYERNWGDSTKWVRGGHRNNWNSAHPSSNHW